MSKKSRLINFPTAIEESILSIVDEQIANGGFADFVTARGSLDKLPHLPADELAEVEALRAEGKVHAARQMHSVRLDQRRAEFARLKALVDQAAQEGFLGKPNFTQTLLQIVTWAIPKMPKNLLLAPEQVSSKKFASQLPAFNEQPAKKTRRN